MTSARSMASSTRGTASEVPRTEPRAQAPGDDVRNPASRAVADWRSSYDTNASIGLMPMAAATWIASRARSAGSSRAPAPSKSARSMGMSAMAATTCSARVSRRSPGRRGWSATARRMARGTSTSTSSQDSRSAPWRKARRVSLSGSSRISLTSAEEFDVEQRQALALTADVLEGAAEGARVTIELKGRRQFHLARSRHQAGCDQTAQACPAGHGPEYSDRPVVIRDDESFALGDTAKVPTQVLPQFCYTHRVAHVHKGSIIVLGSYAPPDRPKASGGDDGQAQPRGPIGVVEHGLARRPELRLTRDRAAGLRDCGRSAASWTRRPPGGCGGRRGTRWRSR